MTAEKAALRLIAKAEQNSQGLAVKLERRGYDSGTVKAVISDLLAKGLLDDGRYAELWIRSRLSLRKAVSPQWLLIALGKRGINRIFSFRALQKVLDPETEYSLLLRYLDKTRISESKGTLSSRAQLKNEGFSSATLDRYYDEQGSID